MSGQKSFKFFGSNFGKILFLFFSDRATITIKTSSIEYRFRCNTTTECNLYKVYCKPAHGMRMLKVPEEATKQCFSELYIENSYKVKGTEYHHAYKKSLLLKGCKLFL